MKNLSFPPASAGRIRPVVQAFIIRAYKIVGLAALTAILIGLICFLSVNLFYLVNSSWVRPVVLSPTHGSVLSTMATLSSESARRDELISEREELEAERDGLDRVLQLNQEFQKEFASAITRPQLEDRVDYQALLARRAYSDSIIDSEKAAARKKVIQSQIERLRKSTERYEKLLADLQGSAYVQATERQVTVAFVPYENLDNVEEGMSIYACRWGLVWCRNVGAVGPALKGEVTETHPQTGSPLRGVMVEIRLSDEEGAEEQALFVDKRPFWIL